MSRIWLDEGKVRELKEAAGEENMITSREKVEKLSKDYFWFSPILKKLLEDKGAEAVIRISGMERLKKVVSICSRARIPLTIRGGGTGNYGQMIPLYGGVMLDLGEMNRILSLAEGVVRAEPGVRLFTIETEARKGGWELRCMPSTWVKSTLAGFLCGGVGGVGSITWGGINHGDNMKSITLLTIEEEPRILKFEERECIKALHTYGTTGVVVEVEMRLAPKVPYDQLIFVSRDWERLLDFCDEAARDTSLRKRLVTLVEWPAPTYFLPIRRHIPEGNHVSFLLLDRKQVETILGRAEGLGIRHVHTIPYTEPPRPPYLTDFTWNHTTLWAIKKDPAITYHQIGYGNNMREKIKLIKEKFGDAVIEHLEWVKDDLKVQANRDNFSCFGITLMKEATEERILEFIDFCRQIGAFVPTPHSYILEDGGAHPDIAQKRLLKDETDPRGIMNPGKMGTYMHNPFAEAEA